MSNESVECPLCMEPMDFDDVDFYPCPCRYQICRFCWDKIINEENGLCPACRKPYNSEHPASYKPRTEEEIKNKIKHSKKVCPKKIKPVPEGKEYLSEYRVLQKNLIFVVGLPMRMADEVELLKGLEYFGRCGKVYKIVINQNQTFPGPQGTPCLSAYVTYHRSEDALKTLVDLKKLEIDGRAVKLSLGTTKYCSQFLRNRRCTKQDCMYLHEMGEHAASFTKEDMANGKHTEYENQLIQDFCDGQKIAILLPASTSTVSIHNSTRIDIESEKTLTRKLSLSLQTSISSGVNGVTISLPSSSSVTAVKSPRMGYNCQITPIGTDPIDASKIYSVSSDSCHSKNPFVHGKESPESLNSSLSYDNSGGGIQISPRSNMSEFHMNNSLLDSFYYLNSQATLTKNQCYDQQLNNNCLSNYSPAPNKTEMEFDRSCKSNPSNNIGQQFKDTADIDFDPINISRLGLAELIAIENRQKMNPYQQHVYSLPSRTMLRPTGQEFLMSSDNDFYNNMSANHRVSSGQSFLHEKQSSNDSGKFNQRNTSSSVNTAASISSGFPSPPPGFESGNRSSIGEPPTSDMMNMIMGHNSADMYSLYQNQHLSTDNPMGLNNSNSSYNNQYSMPLGNNYHNDFNVYPSNGSVMGYSNDLSCHQLSHSWKNAQSLFSDNDIGAPDIATSSLSSSHNGIRCTPTSATSPVAPYYRSHSMNDNSGIRNNEWNGYPSYNNSINDSSHFMTHFPDRNNFLLPMRGQSATVIATSANDPKIYAHRKLQTTSHSINH